jgi:hypothetical protein
MSRPSSIFQFVEARKQEKVKGRSWMHRLLLLFFNNLASSQTAGRMDGEEANRQVSETQGDCLSAPKDI